MGLRVASVSRFLGLEGVGLGCQAVPTPLSPPVLACGVGDSGCQMGLGSLPALLWATCQTDARSSDSPTGSFPTWHQKAPGVTWALCWPCPGDPWPRVLGWGLLNSPLHREAVGFSTALEDGPPTGPWWPVPRLGGAGMFHPNLNPSPSVTTRACFFPVVEGNSKTICC